MTEDAPVLINEQEDASEIKKSDENASEDVTTRKSKKDTKRPYHCGCGKAYLSNPALYTHVKTKHDGKLPEGSYNTVGISTNKRGRPRRMLMISLAPSDQVKQLHRMFELKQFSLISLQFQKSVPLQHVLVLFMDAQQRKFRGEEKQLKSDEKNGQPMRREEQFVQIDDKMVSERDLKVLDCVIDGKGVTEEIVNFFPGQKNCNTLLIEVHPLWTIIKKLQSKTFKKDLPVDADVDTVLGIFLWCVSQYFNQSMYRVTCFIFRAFRECLNDYGYQVLEELNKRQADPTQVIEINPKKPNCSFTQEQNCQNVGFIMTFFLLNYIPKYAPSLDQNIALYLLLDFNNWLNKYQFSKNKLNILPELLEQEQGHVLANTHSSSNSNNNSSSNN